MAPIAMADLYHFPAKSVNMDKAFIQGLKMVNPPVAPGGHGLDDAAACAGTQLADGSYVLGGRAVEGDFATKINADGTSAWAWTSGVAGVASAGNKTNGITAVEQLPSGDVLAVGGLNPLFSFPFLEPLAAICSRRVPL